MSASTDGEGRVGQASQDPTGTQTLRNKFSGGFSSRWRDVRGVIRQTVDRNDALRLQDGPYPTTGTPIGQYAGRAIQDFGVDDDAARQAEWAAWFPTVLERHIRDSMPPARVTDGRHYTATSLRRAYARGLALANQDVRRSAILPAEDVADISDPPDLISRTAHQEALGGQQLATYEDVQRAAGETRAATSRTVRSGLAAGWGVREMASRLTERVDAVGETRTVTIAFTRTVDTVNEAILTRADELGAAELGVIPETVIEDTETGDDEGEARWETAQDSRVCAECNALAGNTYTVDEVRRGDAPRPIRDTHMNCRCRLVIVS